MNLHEYQAKQLLKQFHIPLPLGVCVEEATPAIVEQALQTLPNTPSVVVKAQIHAGGRGKGTFIGSDRHGVQIVPRERVLEALQSMLNHTLVTQQTGPEGKCVHKVYITEPMAPAAEFYVSLLIDRTRGCPVLVVSREGGQEIETVAQNNPESIFKCFIDPLVGLAPFQARQAAYALQLTGNAFQEAIPLLQNLYKAFVALDASLIEINPLVETQDGHLSALDAKVQIDDNALMRHPDLAALDDPSEKDPKEVAAEAAKLNYVALDGNIACLVNGAGLAMATMDMIQHFGGSPANFLDLGGGAKQEQIEAAFRIITQDKRVSGIFINIFAGILRCDTLAQGIVNAAQSIHLHLPLVVRMQGNQMEQAKRILTEASLPLTFIDDFAQAAQTIVRQATQP